MLKSKLQLAEELAQIKGVEQQWKAKYEEYRATMSINESIARSLQDMNLFTWFQSLVEDRLDK